MKAKDQRSTQMNITEQGKRKLDEGSQVSSTSSAANGLPAKQGQAKRDCIDSKEEEERALRTMNIKMEDIGLLAH